jgi:type I restriction enzyme, S subunit
MSELDTVLLSSLLADDKAIAVGVMYPGEDTPNGIPLIRVADIVEGRISSKVGYRISKEVNSEYRRTQLSGNEVLMTLVGRPGTAIKVPSEMTGWNAARALAVLRLADPADRDFFVYSVASPQVQHTIRNWCNTTVQATLNLKEIKALPLPWPNRSTRAAIAATLRALDNKIELNRKMNSTLVAMARALFRDWFVDFGPTHAKMEGSAPYLSPDLWSLFPDRLDDEGKPEGWAYEPLLDLAEWVNGAAYKNMHFSDAPDALPVIKIAELKNGVTGNTQRTATDLGPRYLINDGELLFSWSGNPDTSIDTFLWTGGKAWLNQHIFAVRQNGKRSKPYLHALLKFLKPEFAELARNKQTTGLGHVTKADMQRMMVCAASSEVHQAFDRLIEPIFNQALGLQKETRTLAQTRDILLPRLMSGEIQLKDLEDAS